MKRLILYLLIIMLSSCHTEDKNKGSAIVAFDVTENYPRKVIDINDIADIEYIVPQSTDSSLFTNFVYLSKNYIVAFNYFEWNYVFFDRKGNPISNVARNGQGPEEYVMPLWIQLYDENNDDFFIVTLPNRMQVYDKSGNYKRTLQLRGEDLSVDAIYDYDEEYILCHDKSPSENYPFYLISKQTGSIKNIDLYNASKIAMSKIETKEGGEFRSINASVSYAIKNETGTVLNLYSSDTIFHLSKDLEVAPLFIRTPSIYTMESPVFLTGFIETDEYLFFSTEKFDYSFDHKGIEKGFVLDKKSNSFYEVSIENPDYKGEDLIISPIKMTSLVRSECSSNPHIGVRALSLEKLRTSLDRDELSGKLKELVLSSSDDDQFVLMILRFHYNDK